MGKENNKNYFLKKQKRTLVAIHLKAEKNESGIHICDIDTKKLCRELFKKNHF